MRYDIIIRGGRVVDPRNHRDGVMDVGVAEGVIASVAPGLDPSLADEVIDAEGKLVVPGVVDTHVHLVTDPVEGAPYKMLLRRGVTTAMDMMGGIEAFIEGVSRHGSGLTAACLHAIIAGRDIPGVDAGRAEVGAAIDSALIRGAFGVKILGGHFPLSPETTALIIEEAAERGAYVAFHAGTTANGSNIDGFEEGLELAGGRPLHMCHANAYLRGYKEDVLLENKRLLDGLEANPNITSESYLAMVNGAGMALGSDGRVKSAVSRVCLERKGYATDRDGVEQSIRDGWALAYANVGGEIAYVSAEEGVALCRKKNCDIWCSFAVNNPVSIIACLTARRRDGSFTVDAISTDGGSVPRNVIFESGIRLVAMRYLTMEELVLKSSYFPARMLGLVNKGHLTPGADADLAVFCPVTGKAHYTVGGGRILMAGGVCPGAPSTVITSQQGLKVFREKKMPGTAPDLSQSTFMRGH